MQIVIDISEQQYSEIRKIADVQHYRNDLTPEQLIAHGTFLPKGHGRLIDADKFEFRMYHEAFEIDSDLQKWDSGCWIRYKMFEQNIHKAETIVEAEARCRDEANR